jgi:hypothetical protein
MLTRIQQLCFASFVGSVLAAGCGSDDKVGVTVHIGNDGEGGNTQAAPNATGGVTAVTGGSSSTGGSGGATAGSGGESAGQVKINVGFNTCPEVTLVEVKPLTLEVGGDPAQLKGEATDGDNDDLSVFWSVSSGYLADPTQAKTAYSCTDEGTQTITFTVTDAESCSASVETEVECE